MSRLAKKPVQIPTGVTLKREGVQVVVTGPKGTLSYNLRSEVDIAVENNTVSVAPKNNSKRISAYLGLTRALLANMVTGVSAGFEKKLELVGVGFRAKQDGPKKVTMTLGFSHPVIYEVPEGITVEVADNTNLTIKGIDKQLVGLVASKIRKLRKPEPYKGKGIKYAGEVIRRKQGKSGKV